MYIFQFQIFDTNWPSLVYTDDKSFNSSNSQKGWVRVRGWRYWNQEKEKQKNIVLIYFNQQPYVFSFSLKGQCHEKSRSAEALWWWFRP